MEADTRELELREKLVERTEEKLQDGIHQITLRTLAEECGTSTQMIYKFFGDKTGLFEAVFDKKAGELNERLSNQENTGDPLEDWYSLGILYWDFLYENLEIYDKIYRLEANRAYDRSHDAKPQERIKSIFHESIERCIEDGVIREGVDIESLMDTFWMTTLGNMNLVISGYYPDRETALEAFEKAMDNIYRGVSTS